MIPPNIDYFFWDSRFLDLNISFRLPQRTEHMPIFRKICTLYRVELRKDVCPKFCENIFPVLNEAHEVNTSHNSLGERLLRSVNSLRAF